MSLEKKAGLEKDMKPLEGLQGVGIVFCSSRLKAAAVAEYLMRRFQTVPVELFTKLNSDQQKALILERAKRTTLEMSMIVVATIAFGTGVDIPNVKIVILYMAPDTEEAYQLLGRAGRDQNQATVFVLYAPQERETDFKSFLKNPTCIRKYFVNFFNEGEDLPTTERCCSTCHPNLLELLSKEKTKRQKRLSKETIQRVTQKLKALRQSLSPEIIEAYGDGILGDKTIECLAKNFEQRFQVSPL